MKTIKELLASFKKQKSEKPDPKPRLDNSLERFVVAQERMYPRALEEVKNGRKLSHWIWFEEARAYLAHPILGARLREITTVVLESDKDVDEIFGGIDTIKLRSCMTLFAEIAEGDLFDQILEKCFEGKKDEKTLELLDKALPCDEPVL